jgi:hypothetical protein
MDKLPPVPEARAFMFAVEWRAVLILAPGGCVCRGCGDGGLKS